MIRLVMFFLLFFTFIPITEAKFMPDNGIHLHHQLTGDTINQDQFDALIDNFTSVSQSIAGNFNYSLVLNGDWENNGVNAMTWREGQVMVIELWGGLARRLSVDAINVVLCHEFGHQVGGWPVYYGNDWASVEGQSDYYSAHVCAKKVLRSINYNDQPEYYRRTGQEAACDSRYSDYDDREICYRSMSASLELARLLAFGGKMPSYSTPSEVKVSRIMESHPPAQCRLDTYRAATLCPAKWNDSYMPTTEKMSARYLCTPSKTTWANASRPRCWFVSGL